jgi:pentatricopeptide repeat protein
VRPVETQRGRDDSHAPPSSSSSSSVKAREVFDELQQSGVRFEISTYNTLLVLLRDQHHLNEAMRILKQMHSSGVGTDAQTYVILLHGCFVEGDVVQADLLYEEVVNKVLPGGPLDFRLLRTLVKGYSDHGQKECVQGEQGKSGMSEK